MFLIIIFYVKVNSSSYGLSRKTDCSFTLQYNVTVVGKAGGGGEYEVQPGFGWSNGVAMRLLELFGDRLTPAEENSAASPTQSLVLGLLMALLSLGVRSQFF